MSYSSSPAMFPIQGESVFGSSYQRVHCDTRSGFSKETAQRMIGLASTQCRPVSVRPPMRPSLCSPYVFDPRVPTTCPTPSREVENDLYNITQKATKCDPTYTDVKNRLPLSTVVCADSWKKQYMNPSTQIQVVREESHTIIPEQYRKQCYHIKEVAWNNLTRQKSYYPKDDPRNRSFVECNPRA